MTTTKNFGLAGVASSVQFGKRNGRVKFNTDHFEIRDASDSNYLAIRVLSPSDINDAANKQYVDNEISGIQTELDTTQISLGGLNADGTFVAFSGTNYLDSATSFRDADLALDTAIKVVQDSVLNVTASDVSFSPNGNISADNVQSALQELDSEKLALAGGTMTGGIDMGSNSITNLADPVNSQDAATKSYVDNVVTGLDLKEAVRVATTENFGSQASLVIDSSNVNGGVTYTAAIAGTFGNGIRVAHTNPGSINASLTITVIGNDISVSLATDGSGAIISTAADVANAINTDSNANALVAASAEGDGSGIVGTITFTNLTGGLDVNGGAPDTIDGVALSVGDRILVKNLANAINNGVYVVDNIGTGSDGVWVRAPDFDDIPDVEVNGGEFVFVQEGAVNGDTGWVVITNSPITVGTDPIEWSQFSGAGSLEVLGTSNRITVQEIGNTFTVDIANTYAGQSSISTLGTITSGTWNGTVIGIAYGGTGITSIADKSLLRSTGLDTLEALTVTPDGNDKLLIWDNASDDFTFVNVDTVGGDKFQTVTGDSGSATADNNNDSLAIVGGDGISTVASNITNNAVVTINLDINTLTAEASLADTDEFAFYDSSALAIRKITASELGTYFGGGIDGTQITDGSNTFVDTDAIAGSVTVNVENQTADGTLLLAEFKHGAVASDTNFIFTNGSEEIRIEADGTVADVDIRLVPKGLGTVVLGTASTTAILSASDGDNGENFIIQAGNGSIGTGGNILIQPGSGSTTHGVITINDYAGHEVMSFTGVASAVNHFVTTNSATAGNLKIEATGNDTNISIELFAKGAGEILTQTGYTPTSALALATKEYVDGAVSGNANSYSTITDGVNLTTASGQATLTVTGIDGISAIVSQDTITIGVDIDGQASTTVSGIDTLLIYDTDLGANRKVTAQEIADLSASSFSDPLVRRADILLATTNIGDPLPTNAFITRIIVNIKTAYDNNTEMSILAGVTTIGPADNIDAQATGTYIIELTGDVDYGTQQLSANLSATPTVGSASVIVEYKLA